MSKRGVIVNRRRAKQIRDFSGIRIGNITATDIDFLIEYHDRCFILAETKFTGTELPYGQKLALERLCDACGKPCVAFITEHSFHPEKDIDMAKTNVIEYRYGKQWHKQEWPRALKNAVEDFIRKYGG